MKAPFLLCLVLAAGLLVSLPGQLVVQASPADTAGIYVVNTTDLNVEPGMTCTTHCSLTEAIILSNDHRGPDLITFNIPGGGPFFITVGTGSELVNPLPPIEDNETTIDGTTQPGYAGVPLVFLDGGGDLDLGLLLYSDANVVRGLGLIGFWMDHIPDAIAIDGAIVIRGDGNVIEQNYIGFNPYSVFRPVGTPIGNYAGIMISGGGNIVCDNVISNNNIGIANRSGHTRIYRNRIGTDPGGTSAAGNGVGISASSPIFIGLEDEPGSGNLISGNGAGIILTGYASRVHGNKIGTDITGSYAIPNEDGIWILYEEASQTVIGPYPPYGGEGNLIAFNTRYGIWLTCAQEIFIWGNTVANNRSHGIELQSTPDCSTYHVSMLMNSFHDNGGLGIHFNETERTNDGIDPPVITEIRGVEMRGTACPGCQVEVFLAAADPSGYGEGQVHLTAGYADLEGNFFNTIPRLGPCTQVTATATDSFGNTSEFSANYHIGFCARIPLTRIWIWLIPFIPIGAGTAALLGRRRPSGWLRALLGGVIGIGIGTLTLLLPFVQVVPSGTPSSDEGPEPLLPPCSQVLAPEALSPVNRAVFAPGDDPSFELSPQPDPPGHLRRWFVTVTGPDGSSASLDIPPGTTANLSEIALDIHLEGDYFWNISADEWNEDTGTWQSLCMDPLPRQFTITSSEQGDGPVAVPRAAANCRAGPTTEFSVLSILTPGREYLIQASNTPGNSWLVFDPLINRPCWVSTDLVEAFGDTGSLGRLDPVLPELPSPQPAPVACSQWSGDQQACIANSACTWQPNLYPASPCVNK